MAFSKRVRFGRRAPLGLLRLEFSSAIEPKRPDRTIDFRWEPDPKLGESDERPQGSVDQ